jgi:hypothetical protein
VWRARPRRQQRAQLAVVEVEAEDHAEHVAAVRRFIALEQLRDQDTVVSLLPGMRAAPLHRSCPDL